MNENPHLRRLQELAAARKLWKESEKILNILRTQSAKPKEPSDEEILTWHSKNQNRFQSSAS